MEWDENKLRELRYELERQIDIRNSQERRANILVTTGSTITLLFIIIATAILADLVHVKESMVWVLILILTIEIFLSACSIWFGVVAHKTKYEKSEKTIKFLDSKAFDKNVGKRYIEYIKNCFEENKERDRFLYISETLFCFSLFLLPGFVLGNLSISYLEGTIKPALGF